MQCARPAWLDTTSTWAWEKAGSACRRLSPYRAHAPWLPHPRRLATRPRPRALARATSRPRNRVSQAKPLAGGDEHAAGARAVARARG